MWQPQRSMTRIFGSVLIAMFALPVLAGTSACSSGSSGDSTDLTGDSGSKLDSGSNPDVGFILDANTDVGGDVPVGPTSTTLTATIRDFKLYSSTDATTDPDFENVPSGSDTGWDDHGIVTDALGSDGKPVYKPTGTTVTTHGKAAFDKWYNDVPGTNLVVHYPIVLTHAADGSWGYDSEKTGVPLSASDATKQFFPIDDGTTYATAFGNQGKPHNYSFTVELHTTFVYKGGEFFKFRGDDDVFVYIDGKLVIDLGGIHGPESAEVKADTLGLKVGSEYKLDFFSAERHVTGSNILFSTTLDLKPGAIR